MVITLWGCTLELPHLSTVLIKIAFTILHIAAVATGLPNLGGHVTWPGPDLGSFSVHIHHHHHHYHCLPILPTWCPLGFSNIEWLTNLYNVFHFWKDILKSQPIKILKSWKYYRVESDTIATHWHSHKFPHPYIDKT